jgi:hypothetical protein
MVFNTINIGWDMKQNPVQQFKSDCGRIAVNVDNDMPIGFFHDFLMEIKGLMVDRMIVAHKEQIEQAESAKQLPLHSSEVEAMPDQPCAEAC